VRKHDRPQLAEGGPHPGAEGIDSPALGNEMPRNAGGAPPKLLLCCNFHSGKVINKVSQWLIWEPNDGKLTLSVSRRGHAAAGISRRPLARVVRITTCKTRVIWSA
jgi:hypothetical protein